MGILLMNVAGFALPDGAYFNPAAIGAPSPADIATWAIAFVFVDGKMRALFSILFGASMLIVVTRAEAAGRDPKRVHLARMATLALFGLVHATLWPGDILLHYAIVGTMALPLTQLEPRQLAKVALLLLLAQAAVQGWLLLADVQLRATALGPGADAATVTQWRDFAAGVGIGHPADIAAEIARRRGPALALFATNLSDVATGVPFVLMFDGLETLAYMALGMALLPMLAGTRRFPRFVLPAMLAALILSALLARIAMASGFDTIVAFAAATLGGVALRPVIAIGYAALAVPLLARDGAVPRRLAAVGTLAFSNYLATTLVMTALFDGWGLGLFGRLTRAQCTAIVPLVWLAMLAWSPIWAARFRHGPLEWCWRRLARKLSRVPINPIETN